MFTAKNLKAVLRGAGAGALANLFPNQVVFYIENQNLPSCTGRKLVPAISTGDANDAIRMLEDYVAFMQKSTNTEVPNSFIDHTAGGFTPNTLWQYRQLICTLELQGRPLTDGGVARRILLLLWAVRLDRAGAEEHELIKEGLEAYKDEHLDQYRLQLGAAV